METRTNTPNDDTQEKLSRDWELTSIYCFGTLLAGWLGGALGFGLGATLNGDSKHAGIIGAIIGGSIYFVIWASVFAVLFIRLRRRGKLLKQR